MTTSIDTRNQALRDALRNYMDAEEIDDPHVRLEELAVCRTEARKLLAMQEPVIEPAMLDRVLVASSTHEYDIPPASEPAPAGQIKPEDCEFLEFEDLVRASKPAPAIKIRDWIAVAQAAGKYGIRYPTNWRLEEFLAVAFAASEPAPAGAPYRFDRWKDGQLMAEGIVIERAGSLEQAIQKALRLCPEPKGRTVLVHQPAPASAPSCCGVLRQVRGALILDAMVDDAGEFFGTTQVALEAINEALCDDEGCPHHSTLHVCVARPAPFEICIDCITTIGCKRESRCKWPGHILPASEPAPASAPMEWCQSCGAVSARGECDCTRNGTPERRRAVPYVDAEHRPAPASAPSELRDLALGDTYLEAGADLHTSGINVGKHGNRIQCYGRKPEDAEALRDEVWRVLTAPASAPSCCGWEGLKLSFISGAMWMRDNPAKTAEAWIEKAASESAAAIRARAQPCQCGELRTGLETLLNMLAGQNGPVAASLKAVIYAALSTGPRSGESK